MVEGAAPLPRPRRGVLLLVILSMLTLFLMLGTAYLITATRAREAARAAARLTFGGDDVRVPAAQMLDTVLLKAVRGPTVANGTPFESLLADKYGLATLSGTVTGIARSGPILTATASLPSGRPTDLVGRVLTFAQPGRPVTSHRIVRARPSGAVTNASSAIFDLTLDIPLATTSFSVPTVPVPIIVNGREFAGAAPDNEAWDGFDDNNRFLAQLRSSTSSISRADVVRGSFLTTTSATAFNVAGTNYTLCQSATSSSVFLVTGATDFDGDLVPDGADNDGDGVIDGIFQDFGIPPVYDEAGNQVRLRASVLVVDLDGRFNVNAHDALPRLLYAGTSRWTTTVSTSAAPLGSGYGPAEINGQSGTRVWTSNTSWTSGTHLYPGGPGAASLITSSTFRNSEQPTVFTITGGPASYFVGRRNAAAGSRYSDNEPTYELRAVEGRYGERAANGWTNILVSDLATPSSASFAVPGRPAIDDDASRLNDRRAAPSEPADVSYGPPPVWWNITAGTNFNWRAAPSAGLPEPRGTYNSPPDLHGRMKTVTGTAVALSPIVTFAKAEWSDTAAGGGRETTDDPYELMVDTRRGYGGLLFDSSAGGSATTASSIARDNPFTPAELEPVLRPYDVDTNRCPPRLAAMLGSVSEESRLKITTDSWDTTAITGSAALVLFGTHGGASGWLQRPTFATLPLLGTSPLAGVLGGEVARGERFDLNRPLTASGTANAGYDPTDIYYRQRQAYFKDLYTLLYALEQGSGGPLSAAASAEIAQWVANVVEFRDADSIMTPFEYDVDPSNSNGWAVDGDVTTGTDPDRAVVFGVERPEMLIMETLAWERVDAGLGVGTTGTTGGMCISLHRPWNAVATGTGTVQIPGEPCDYALDTLASGSTGRPLNLVNLGKKPHANVMSGTTPLYGDTTNAAYPIWRLRIVSAGGTQYVRFDTDTTSGPNELLISGTISPSTGLQPGNGNDKPKLPVDTTYTFFSGTSGTVGTTGTSFTISGSARQALSPADFRVAGGPPAPFVAPSRPATVYLERLANPSIPASGSVWTAAPLATSTTSGTNPQQYVVVDSATMTVVNTGTQPPPPTLAAMRRDVSSGTTAPWRISGTSVAISGSYPTLTSSTNTAWMPWPNRPFVSSAELTLVPRGHAVGILENYRQLTPAVATGTSTPAIGIPVSPHLLFDAVHVPTRFAGIHQTYTGDLSGTTGVFSTGSNAVTTVNQLSSFREPGRVNLNTVPAADVWNAVVAGQLPTPVVSWTSATLATAPAQSMYATLSLASGSGSVVVSDTTSAQLDVSLNPLHGIYTATRLANTTTPRSNVFAVWITLQESVANDPDSIRYHRAFYIVDRTIPVGFEIGENHNVWNCVRLRRIIE